MKLSCPGCHERVIWRDSRLELAPLDPLCDCGHERSEHVAEWGCAASPICDCTRFRAPPEYAYVPIQTDYGCEWDDLNAELELLGDYPQVERVS